MELHFSCQQMTERSTWARHRTLCGEETACSWVMSTQPFIKQNTALIFSHRRFFNFGWGVECQLLLWRSIDQMHPAEKFISHIWAAGKIGPIKCKYPPVLHVLKMNSQSCYSYVLVFRAPQVARAGAKEAKTLDARLKEVWRRNTWEVKRDKRTFKGRTWIYVLAQSPTDEEDWALRGQCHAWYAGQRLWKHYKPNSGSVTQQRPPRALLWVIDHVINDTLSSRWPEIITEAHIHRLAQ